MDHPERPQGLDRAGGTLKISAYMAGDDFSIADIATYPWLQAAVDSFGKIFTDPLESRDDLARWMRMVGGRPSVTRGMQIPPSS